ncbi:hypothetical protein, partial [Klebsiella pneumoniae]|uniref:hypothetical protein n=1 Tax=Klebsiella pneumoniae TaxID=573 RepID=UPI001C6F4619
MSLAQPIAATILSLSLEKDALARFEMFKCLASVDDLITGVFSTHFIIPKYCIFKGLPRSWWEDSERHIQFSIVEHHSQLKALPVP